MRLSEEDLAITARASLFLIATAFVSTSIIPFLPAAITAAAAGLAFALSLALFTMMEAVKMVSLEYVQYAVIAYLIYRFMRPNPVAFSQARYNRFEVARARWRDVDFDTILKQQAPRTGKRYVVLGAGFVGKRIIHMLLQRGETHIVAFDADPSACECFKGEEERVRFVRGDVTKYEQLLEVMRGAEVVFATFAVIRYMDSFEFQKPLSYRVNVQGTENALRAAKACGIRVFVQTSTSNVSVCAEQVSLAMSEKEPYVTPDNSPNHYSSSKALAEQLVLKADGVNGMRTGAIRPCSGVFGAEDRHLLECALKLGRTPLPPNGGSTVIDFVPVENVAFAHLLLERKLGEERLEENVGGEAFCISNDSPMRMIDFMGVANALRPGGITLIPTPELLLSFLARLVDACVFLGLPLPSRSLAMLTTTTLRYLDLSYAFSSRKARERLGYKPVYTVEQAVHKSVEEYLNGGVMMS